MPFPPDIKAQVLLKCERICCLCYKLCQLNIEVHHIVEESKGGPSTVENAIALCFDCHSDMRSYDQMHAKGNKYTEKELKSRRDDFYRRYNEDPIGFRMKCQNRFIGNQEIKISPTDIQVFNEIMSLLPWYGCMEYADQDYTGHYKVAPLDIICTSHLKKNKQSNSLAWL